MSLSSIILWTSLAALVGYFGRTKRFGFWGYFIASMVFTPLGGLLLLVPTEPKEKPTEEA